MTPEERKMLKDLHDAFMEPPKGDPNGRSLIQDIREVVTVYKRGSWLTKAMLWLVPTIAGVIAAWGKIVQWFAQFAK